MWRKVPKDLRMVKKSVKLSEQKMKTINHWIANSVMYQHHIQ
jgi:hypothetical protein